ncbi:facilitated trehalose transporter Tret1 [Tribolium castaneum]|nr:PREDICTED: facilitated trehalose transporter Tret1 [Tribolium castaneum]|eukprot:XP_972187.1 PREDICTED: facilitated trehalose transporter Tret1 [Tribolium castaneum]
MAEPSLQEVVYKPTTDTPTPTALKPSTAPTTSAFLSFSAAIADLAAFSAGVAFGWPSPVLPKLAGHNNPLGRPITHTQASWIAGLVCLGAILGPLLAGPVADKLGRKKALILAACPMTGSLLLAAYATTLPWFYLSRFAMGVGAGSVFTVLPIYLAEIAQDHNRGTLGCSMGAFVASGLLFAFAVGPFLEVGTFCLVCTLPLLVFLAVFSAFVPESPFFLAAANRSRDLEQSLMKLRNSENVGDEVLEITQRVFEERKIKTGLLDLFKFRALRRGLVVTLGIVILQQFAGINAVLSYLQTIFEASGSGQSPEMATIIIGVVQMVATVVTSLLADRLGRRVLLLTSAVGSSVALLALGLYFYRKGQHLEVGAISWLPVASLVVYMVAFNVGLGPLPWAVMGELFPSSVKSVAAGFTCFICFVAAFVITLLFPILSNLVGMANSFWFFAGMCLLGAFFIYWMLPETKGKSVQEIQKLLGGD